MDRYLIETPHTEQNCRDLVDLVNAAGYLHQSNDAMARLGPHDSHRHRSVLPDRLESRIVSQDTDEHIQKPRTFIRREPQGDLGRQEFYRAFSLVNGGRARESDLFEGLR
jgi:hypothetical protein